MTGQELVFGLHAVAAALREPAGVQELWVDRQRQDGRMRAVLAEARERGVMIHLAGRAELDRLTGQARHQGVAARLTGEAASTRREPDLSELLATVQGPPLLLVLDGVQDPHNLGACLRSADAAGVHAVIAPADRAAGLTPAVRKVACGAAETVPFVPVTNLARTLRWLKTQRLWIVGAAGEAELSLYEVDFTSPVAIVLGAEEQGLRRLTRELCDYRVRIPMAGSVPSLNVSVAAGVLLFEAVRQRIISRVWTSQ